MVKFRGSQVRSDVAGTTNMIKGIDHVALPMENVRAMLAFYKSIGAEIFEEVPGFLHAAYLGGNKINLHMPAAWQSSKFSLRGPNAIPGCGDLCFAWVGSPQSLADLLRNMGAQIVEGPIQRKGGSGQNGISTYTRDPDGNLIEFIIYERSVSADQ